MTILPMCSSLLRHTRQKDNHALTHLLLAGARNPAVNFDRTFLTRAHHAERPTLITSRAFSKNISALFEQRRSNGRAGSTREGLTLDVYRN